MSSYNTVGSLTPSRDLKVPQAVNELQNVIERLAKTAEELSLRLSNISTPSAPNSINPRDEVLQKLAIDAPLVVELSQKTEQIRQICSRLDDVISRLEI